MSAFCSLLLFVFMAIQGKQHARGTHLPHCQEHFDCEPAGQSNLVATLALLLVLVITSTLLLLTKPCHRASALPNPITPVIPTVYQGSQFHGSISYFSLGLQRKPNFSKILMPFSPVDSLLLYGKQCSPSLSRKNGQVLGSLFSHNKFIPKIPISLIPSLIFFKGHFINPTSFIVGFHCI